MTNFGKSGDPNTLYHYCDAHAFESIVRTNDVWLCPFSLSNDSMEGQSCHDVLRGLANETSIPQYSFDAFIEHLKSIGEVLKCYGMSLSRNADQLSQWRGYAADGAGFAIGFDRGLLNQMPDVSRHENAEILGIGPKLVKVEYREPHTTERMRGLFESLQAHIKKGFPANSLLELTELDDAKSSLTGARQAINNKILFDWGNLYSIKGEAFEEEQEWRLTLTAFDESPGFSFRVSRGMLTPYLKYPLPQVAEGLNPVSHVVLGPKNNTPVNVVELLLRKYGHRNVQVVRSAATYR